MHGVSASDSLTWLRTRLVWIGDGSRESSSPFPSSFPPFFYAPDPFPDWAEDFVEA